ncbi:MAG: D-aminoacyl-tRNA deacylase [Bacilli bacterium]
MKVLVQRVISSEVKVDGKIVGKSGPGLLLFVGFTETDTSKEIDYMVDKVINLRIFDDETGIMNRSILDINGSILSISQFTLYANASKGRRPSYIKALNGKKATLLYDEFNNKLKNTGIPIETGIFGADMKVSLTNDGPITIMLEK